MSDTGSNQGSAPRGGCAGKLVKLLLVLALGLGGYAAWAYRAAQATAPLPFERFQYRTLERSVVSAKWELRELAGGLTGGSAEVKLDERELNALLFGDAQHTPESKARVLIQGDALRVEASRPKDGGGYWNVQATVKASLGPDDGKVELVEAQVGGYAVDPLTRWALARAFERELAAARARDPVRLGRVKALWVEGGHVRLVYDSPPK